MWCLERLVLLVLSHAWFEGLDDTYVAVRSFSRATQVSGLGYKNMDMCAMAVG